MELLAVSFGLWGGSQQAGKRVHDRICAMAPQ
jgi:hypothetical protein